MAARRMNGEHAHGAKGGAENSLLAPVRTMRQHATDRLRQAIPAGRFHSGERLKEISLASGLGVSRGSIRDALLQLTSKGVLERLPNCGLRRSSRNTPR